MPLWPPAPPRGRPRGSRTPPAPPPPPPCRARRAGGAPPRDAAGSGAGPRAATTRRSLRRQLRVASRCSLLAPFCGLDRGRIVCIRRCTSIDDFAPRDFRAFVVWRRLRVSTCPGGQKTPFRELSPLHALPVYEQQNLQLLHSRAAELLGLPPHLVPASFPLRLSLSPPPSWTVPGQLRRTPSSAPLLLPRSFVSAWPCASVP